MPVSRPSSSQKAATSVADVAMRRAAMAVLAESETSEIAACLASLGNLPASEDLRRAERGLVMVTGRVGGDGASFNLGEATVARSAVQLSTGETGFGYVLGRDLEKARLIALCDALIQRADFCDPLERFVVAPLREKLTARRRMTDERTAATRVDFFTLVRGED
jgi:alpha-D-ribose 1-methylphosphonate 5-triphosphate synthase subunit PhnG